MKSQLQVEALQSNICKTMQEEFVRFQMIAEQSANRLCTKFPEKLDTANLSPDDRKLVEDVLACRCKVITDINQIANCKLEQPLQQFSTTQLFEWRTKLADKNIV